MHLPTPLIRGKILRRYKRFLADIQLDDQTIVTAHCPNTGSMKTCLQTNDPVILSKSQNPNRKLSYTLELIHNGNCWICINTHLANKIILEALQTNNIPELQGYEKIEPEKKYGQSSRVDFLLKKSDGSLCFVEVKTVTYLDPATKMNMFPDAVSTRGQKHLTELIAQRKLGHRCVMLYLVQRSDGRKFAPAKSIDPKYAELLETAQGLGVEILCYQSKISETEITLQNRIANEISEES